MEKLSGIKHICFDVDDTFYPLNEDLNQQLYRVAYKCFLQKIKEQTLKDISYDDFLKLYHELGSMSKLYEENGLNPKLVESCAAHIDKTNFFNKDLKVVETLKLLRKKYTLSIYSNTTYKNITNTLKHLGLTAEEEDKIFQVPQGTTQIIRLENNNSESIIKESIINRNLNVLSAEDDVRFKRPNTEGFKWIISCLKLRPEEIVFVGDNDKKDIIPAKKMGLKTIQCSWNKREKSQNADAIVDTFYQLSNIL
ncbi:HAD family hydrolase [Nanoarchaeota archaeon]